MILVVIITGIDTVTFVFVIITVAMSVVTTCCHDCHRYCYRCRPYPDRVHDCTCYAMLCYAMQWRVAK